MSTTTAEQRRVIFRSYMNIALGPALAAQARYSTAGFPTLLDVSILNRLVTSAGLTCDALLRDDSALTALERAQGNWRPVVDQLAGPPGIFGSVAASAASFAREVAPMQTGARTRQKHFASWRTVLTWAAAKGCLHRILPMDKEAHMALCWDALTFGSSVAVLKGILGAVQARHRAFGLEPPLSGRGVFSNWVKSLARFAGRQSKWLYPIHKSHVAAMLAADPHDVHQWRDLLAASVATICCLRPSEGAALQVCDLWLEWDRRSGVAGFEGTAALNISSRKNDQARKGHHPRIGRSRSPALDANFQLVRFMHVAGIAPDAACSKRENPAACCPRCPPLFPLSAPLKAGFDRTKQPSSDAFSAAVMRGLAAIHLDTSAFSGVCARRGGLSTAIEAGVPEAILWMQSGHAQDKAARRYVKLTSPARLYDCWGAFDL